MKPLRLEEVWRILPPLDELRPVHDLLATTSTPDPARAWAGSGELGTVGDRLVARDALDRSGPGLAERMGAHLAAVYRRVGEALGCLGAGDATGAARAFLALSALEEEEGRTERAAAWARAAALLARDRADGRLAALALRRWGRALRAQGAFGEARDRYLESLAAAEAVSDARGAAEAAVGAGNVLEDQGAWDRAAELYR
ncbi:MAG: hypothetical protein RQ751_07505, partial [Longimicrobiales bacterium]|nr:hypothetical protein [Longimicrobiales bacterium]